MESGSSGYDNDSEPIEPAPLDMLEDHDFTGFSDYGTSLGTSGFTSLASYVLRHSHQDGRCVCPPSSHLVMRASSVRCAPRRR